MSESSRSSLVLRLGVTGHRSVVGTELSSVVACADAVFRAIVCEIAALAALDQVAAVPVHGVGAPELTCFTGLAAGADHALAKAAIAQGFKLIAILAFAREDFERDFTDEVGLMEFRSLLSRTSSVVELNGDRSQEVDAYVAVGQYLVERSDIVVAVWDGQQARGPGGTGEVIASALRAGKPVLSISPSDPENPQWLGAEALNVGTAVWRALASQRRSTGLIAPPSRR